MAGEDFVTVEEAVAIGIGNFRQGAVGIDFRAVFQPVAVPVFLATIEKRISQFSQRGGLEGLDLRGSIKPFTNALQNALCFVTGGETREISAWKDAATKEATTEINLTDPSSMTTDG